MVRVQTIKLEVLFNLKCLELPQFRTQTFLELSQILNTKILKTVQKKSLFKLLFKFRTLIQLT